MVRALATVLLLAASAGEPRPGAGAAPAFEASFLYSLSTNFGTLPLNDVGLSYDPVHHELYVTGHGPLRVFNDAGMEVYSFADSPDLGSVRSVAALDDGDLIAFARREGRLAIFRCTFRGEFLREIAPRNVPASLSRFAPSVMRYRGGKIYLADMVDMRILVLDAGGEYLASYDVAEKLEGKVDRTELGLRGFNVDGEGNLLFTIQPLFRAFIMSPQGELRGFGQKGGAPGRFNIVGGITRDDAGNIYVSDLLKSAVIVFDRDLQFVKEFGYRGRGPGNLVTPEEILAAEGKLFVSNRRNRGVSVFRVGPAVP